MPYPQIRAAATGLPVTEQQQGGQVVHPSNTQPHDHGRIPAGARASVFSDRRSLLRALAGAAVLRAAAGLETSPAAAAESSDAADPVFAAIEKHRQLEAAFSDVCELTDEVAAREEGREVTPSDEETYERALAASDEGLEELLAMTPVTVGGIRAMLTYVFDRGEFDSLDDDLVKACVDAVLRSPVLMGGVNV